MNQIFTIIVSIVVIDGHPLNDRVGYKGYTYRDSRHSRVMIIPNVGLMTIPNMAMILQVRGLRG